jgi:heme exporter protein A
LNDKLMELSAQDLACERGERMLFSGLSFRLAAGEALVVTGPNGAGKTSLLRMIAGFLRPSRGRVVVSRGEDAPTGTLLHFVGHQDALQGALTGRENLAFAGAIMGTGAGTVAPALARLGLAELADIPARALSAGQRRRLALARLLVAPRPLWLLDEPITGLDTRGQDTLRALAREHLDGGGLLVATTHVALDLPHANELALGGRGP